MHHFWRLFPKQEKAGEGGEGAGGSGDGGKGGEGASGGNAGDLKALLDEIKSMRTEITALKATPKKDEEDPTLKAIREGKLNQEKEKAGQNKIANAAKFNIRFENFLKEYAGVIPADANEIPKIANEEKYPGELERSSAIKAALMQSFFKEEKNLKFLSESQLAKWKAYQSLGTVGRQEEAEALYETVFEPAVNHARSLRQSEIKNTDVSYKGSSDSDIIFKKVHEKLLRSIGTNHKFNDVLHAQAKGLGLVTENS